MTPDEIAKARFKIDRARIHMPSGAYDFAYDAKPGWSAALDEVERLKALLEKADQVISASDTITMARWKRWREEMESE